MINYTIAHPSSNITEISIINGMVILEICRKNDCFFFAKYYLWLNFKAEFIVKLFVSLSEDYDFILIWIKIL